MKGQIGIVGAGLVGRGWAIVFARAGYGARLYDAAPGATERCLAAAAVNLADLERAGLIESAASVGRNLVACKSMGEALGGVDYAQESVTEDRDIKARVFAEMDALAPKDAVLASSCSAIPGSRFLAAVPGRARCLVAHPANPPHLMPVVELVPTEWTTPATLARCRDLLTQVGQVPVVLNREIEGFVMNRLQAGVVNEAVQLVARGIMSADDIDKVMRHSLGLRWSFMGPFETMDLNAPAGFKDYATRYGKAYEAMGARLFVADPWAPVTVDAIEADRRRQVPPDEIADRQAWRDRRLMALLRHIAQSDRDFGK